MGTIDFLSDLANALEVFFKGLSECGLLTTYSVQLQVFAVDSAIQIKFQLLLYQFMKTVQNLLFKIKIPGHENTHDVSVQTTESVLSEILDVKKCNSVVAEHLGALVETCVFTQTDDPVIWEEEHAVCETTATDSASYLIESDCHSPASTDIIVACSPSALAVISEQNIITASELVLESESIKTSHSLDDRDNFYDVGSKERVVSDVCCVQPVSQSNPEIVPIIKCDIVHEEETSEIIESCHLRDTGVNEIADTVQLDSPEQSTESLCIDSYEGQGNVIETIESVMHIVESSELGTKDRCHQKSERVKSKDFKCKKCNKSFLSHQSLEVHCNRKHGSIGQCDMCPRLFSSIQSLQEHCRLEHGGTGCFTCPVCSRRFMTKLSYKRHLDTHGGKKGAICDMCGKTFSRTDYLKMHYMTHSGIRPLSCSQCPRKFITSSHLKNHEKIHTGKREHTCELCPKAFSRGDKLKEHMLRHLNIKRFQCAICKHGYAEKRDLTTHMRAHHKVSENEHSEISHKL